MCVKGGGERSISHTQKGIQGGNVRGDDVSEWAWVMEKAFREKRKKKKKKSRRRLAKKKIENLTAFLIVGRKPGKATSRRVPEPKCRSASFFLFK